MNTFIIILFPESRGVKMPKIIDNLPSRLQEEARRQIQESGYGSVTMRSIAEACDVALGTLYNYYPSKDALIASFMEKDWQEAMSLLLSGSPDSDALPLLDKEHTLLIRFLREHEKLFSDPEAIHTYSLLSRSWHIKLRGQLASPIEAALRKTDCADPAFLSQFLIESLLSWTLAGIEKEQLFNILIQLIPGGSIL